MTYLLDTNICSAHIRRPAGLAHRFIQHSGRLFVPTIVLAELYAGAYMIDSPARILDGIKDLLQDLAVLDFDQSCAIEFGRLRGILKRRGIAANPIDLQVASVALVNDLIVVTNNTRDFEKIPDLRLEDWLTP